MTDEPKRTWNYKGHSIEDWGTVYAINDDGFRTWWRTKRLAKKYIKSAD